MPTTTKPVFFSIKENKNFLDRIEKEIKDKGDEASSLLLDYPTIYFHVWQNKYDRLNNRYSIYVGESNDIVQRTKEHWIEAKLPKDKRDQGNWQYHMLEDKDENGNPVIPTLYVFGHKKFNKSLTLDLENRMIDYCLAMHTAHTHNGRGNPQREYHTHENLDPISHMVWRKLHQINQELFIKECEIKKSALYRASPNHVLTPDQKACRSAIIQRVYDVLLNNVKGQLIFVEGEAGTGKTVLTNTIFYDLLEDDNLKLLGNKIYLLVNHDEQLGLFKNMARRLGYPEKDDDIIQNPTHFLKQYSKLSEDGQSYIPVDDKDLADIVFVDESHLLWNQSNQAFNSKFKDPQLDEIMKRSRVTVIMYDENQVMHKGQIATDEYMKQKRELAKAQGVHTENGFESNYIVLRNQLRMTCSQDTMKWIDDFSKDLTLNDLHLNADNKDSKNYEVKIFDSPSKLHSEIKKKAKNEATQLSRVLATYDWKYILGKTPDNGDDCWRVKIGNWSLPWNEELYHSQIVHTASSRDKKKYSSLDWAEKDYTIDEVGSTFTIQGFDLMYAGVILGPSVKYNPQTKKIYFDESKRAWDKMKGTRTLQDGRVVNVTNTLSMHELRVLLTRGTDGLYIYACDPELRKALKECIKK